MFTLRLIPLPVVFLVAAAQAQTTYDSKFLEYTGLKYPCEGGVTPVVKIQNVGSATMSGCVVETWKNGIMVNSFDWQLAVPALTGQVRQPVLPTVPSVGPEDELEFRIISVNTVPDEDPNGNFLPVELDEVPSASPSTTITIEVETDLDPGDLTWEIKNDLAQVIASGGPYAEPNTLVTTNVVLGADACFSFKATDAGRGSGSEARMRVKSGTNTLIAAMGEALVGGYSKGLTTGNNEGCTENLVLEFTTDTQPWETSWELIDQGTAAVVCASAGGYPASEVITEGCCLPAGCYRLRMMDLGGDGITGGGYILRTSGTQGLRIIDDRNNFSTGSLSAISGQQGFCLPLSGDKLIFTSCDKLDWTSGQYLVASANPGVSAEFAGPNAATSGYEFWLFDPNGTYSFRKFRSHTVSDGFAPNNATRACHLKINNWNPANQVPTNVLMNAAVRARVAGVNGSFGPVCRFKIDPARAQCPLTKLMDVPGSAFLSCGSTRAWGAGNYVHARPVAGANKYQFRFRIPGELFEVVRTSNTYFVQLNWITNPLQDGVTYDVDVRASKNGGLSWCTDPSPIAAPWGDLCQLTMDNTPMNGGENMAMELASTGSAQLMMYPNPNRGDQLAVSLAVPGMSDDVKAATVCIFDATGKRLMERTLAVHAGAISTTLDLGGAMMKGLYFVGITAGGERYTERLIIGP